VIFNGTMLDSRYDTPSDTSINGKHVEYAPSAIIRTGLQATYKGLRGSFLVSHTTEQFTDAKNTLSSANATAGKIPAYTVADLTLGYTYDRYSIDVSCNNLFGNSFFTRRTGSYPGPGIIPAEPRNAFATLRVAL
jgi:Fe(3+) dicitrate transport protein